MPTSGLFFSAFAIDRVLLQGPFRGNLRWQSPARLGDSIPVCCYLKATVDRGRALRYTILPDEGLAMTGY